MNSLNSRFIHHFTIAEIGSLVTYRSHPHPFDFIYHPILLGKVGIIKSIENRTFDQLLTVDFNFVLNSNDKKGNESIGPLWTISGDNLAPLLWPVNMTLPPALLRVPPELIKRSTQLKADHAVSGGTPSGK